MSQYVTTPDGVRHAFPDDATPDEMNAALNAQYGAPKLNAMPSPSQRMRNRTLAFLPTAGGAVGGLAGSAFTPEVGPLGPIGGAALGGAAGKSLQTAFLGRPASPSELGGSALAQGTQEAVGLGAGALAGKFGRGIARKAVSFQRAPKASVILNEFGRPFMVEGKTVAFNKAVPKQAGHAADMAVDLATHSLGPGGVLIRPMLRSRGVRAGIASMASGLGGFIGSRGFQNFARQFPRAAMALKQLATYEDQPDSTGQ
jgi:hypothetical protein